MTPTNIDHEAIRRNRHHEADYLTAEYENNPDNFKEANPDNCNFYPGEKGYLPDGMPIVYQCQLDEPVK